MKLTKTEMNRIATLMAKADSEDMNMIASMFNNTQRTKQQAVAKTFAVGDAVKWSGRNGNMTGIVVKVNPKNIKVKTSMGLWNVTATLLKKA
jgi:putative ribosome biogenesis GTPase RsgA